MSFDPPVDLDAVRERIESRRKKLTIGDHALMHLLVEEVERLRATVGRIAESGRDELNVKMAKLTLEGASFPGPHRGTPSDSSTTSTEGGDG